MASVPDERAVVTHVLNLEKQANELIAQNTGLFTTEEKGVCEAAMRDARQLATDAYNPSEDLRADMSATIRVERDLKSAEALQIAEDALEKLKSAIEKHNADLLNEARLAAVEKSKQPAAPLSRLAATDSPLIAKPAPAAPAAAAVSGPDTKDLLSAYAKYLADMKGSEDAKADWQNKAEATPPTLSFPDKESADAFLKTQAEAGKNFIAITMGPDGKPTGEYAIGSGGTLTSGKLDPKQMERVQRGLNDPMCNDTFRADISKALKEGSNDGVDQAIEKLNVLRRPDGYIPPPKPDASKPPTTTLGHLGDEDLVQSPSSAGAPTLGSGKGE